MPAKPQAGGAKSATALKDAFRAFMADPATDMPEATNPVQEILDEHFGSNSLELPTGAIRYNRYLQVSYQRAVDEFLAEEGRTHHMTGVRCPSVPDYRMGEMSFARLLSKPTFAFVPPVFCPVDYAVVPCGTRETMPILRQGMILFKDAEGPAAFWIRLDEWNQEMVCEVMSTSVERGEKILAGLREASIRLSPFQGQVLEIADTPIGPVINFVERPRPTSRDEVILPGSMLDQIERHSLGAVNAREILKASGRHLKRGLLLHGRPGTGKTHTIKYLIGQMPEATVAVMSAGRMHDIGVIRKVIDVIVPGVIILDDVDLIAEDRSFAGARFLLFELLDVLDGIAEDNDLLFVMTTNRPNEIEPAIAARPGRVDQAIEVPLPDAECRTRLFKLYAKGLDLQMSDDELASFIDRTDGVTASFIREVLRRATVSALDADSTSDPIVVTGERVIAALDELLDPDNPLTPLLLGAEPKHALPTVTVAQTRSS